ncbi:uncharacterized protein LOC8023432 [Ixodes scapularis]|uniref:uncharacterized protein LOC8023432 n=1 Tax=Ixodes scapularis TaxID=6945 RepID=UPI001A9E9503|nr:uncharacterized protein LOC8023432 [Ixodes scapularis]
MSRLKKSTGSAGTPLSEFVLDILTSSSSDDEDVLAARPDHHFRLLDWVDSPTKGAAMYRATFRKGKHPLLSCSPKAKTLTPRSVPPVATTTATATAAFVTPVGDPTVAATPPARRAPACRAAWIGFSTGRGRRPSWLEGSSSEEEDGADRKAPLSPEERDRDAWFLESLSEAVEPERSQPDALLFRRRFGVLRDKLVSELFTVFNRELFRDRLPRQEIAWRGRLTSTAGRCVFLEGQSYRVELSTVLLTSAERTRDTLLHELCHAAAWCVQRSKGGHGHAWRFWTDQAKQRFPKLPTVSTCHSYKVQRTLFT